MSESTDLVIIGGPIVAADLFKPGGIEAILQQIETKVRAIPRDISTPTGRAAVKSLARTKIARSKTALIAAGKQLTEDWRKQTKAVNDDCKIIETRMDALRDEVTADLDEWESRDKRRVEAHEAAILAIANLTAGLHDESTVDEIAARHAQASEVGTRDWQEFAKPAAQTRADTVDALARMLAKARKRDADRDELARLRAEEAERQRQRSEQERAEREARIAAEAAEVAKRAAEAEAARQAQEAAAEAARREQEAAAAAVRRQQEIEARAEAARQAILAKAEQERIAAERAAHEREAKAQAEAAKAERAARESADREAMAKARAEQAERDAAKARTDAEAAAAKAEADRLAAAERAQREQTTAVEAERQRQADAQAMEEAATKRREADKAHRAKINNEAMQGLVTAGLSDKEARVAVVAIAKGLVPHARITY